MDDEGKAMDTTRLALVAALALWVCACGSSNVDVSGTYSGTVTNGVNSCPGTWTTGQTSNADVTVAQTGSSVSIQVQGAAGALLQLGFGTNAFTGSVSGDHISAMIIGSVQATAGGCQYTFDGNLSGNLSGDTLSGTITYTPKTNGNADCTTMSITGCSRGQSFTMNRPPKTM
jgi:hypothetical protein